MRIDALTTPELLIAYHEAGHAVVALALDVPLAVSARIWQEDDGWGGAVAHGSTAFAPPQYPDPKTTPPHVWHQSLCLAWAGMIVAYAGPAATVRRMNDRPLSPGNIRAEPSGAWDEANAATAANHFWPVAHRETVLDSAAGIAQVVIEHPTIWSAIQAVAGFMLEHARHRASGPEIEAIVRRFFPMPLPCPKMEWAVGLADMQTTL